MTWVNAANCKTCVYGNKKAFGDPEKHRVVIAALENNTYVKCHVTGAICKGFHAAHPMHSQYQRSMTRLEEERC